MSQATSSVDADTDQHVQATLRSAAVSSSRTVITIAHRLETIMDYDKILLLSEGSVLEFGTPETLLEDTSGAFSDLCRGARQ